MKDKHLKIGNNMLEYKGPKIWTDAEIIYEMKFWHELEEISTWYDSDNDLVTIEYVIMDKYGDFEETKQIIVSASEIEKHISK